MLEKRLDEVREEHARLKERESEIQTDIRAREESLAIAQQQSEQLLRQIDDIENASGGGRRNRRAERRRRKRSRRKHTIYRLGLHASKIRSLVANGISDYGWSKLSSREAWELHKFANRQLYAKLMAYLDGHLSECQDYIKVGDGIALWRNITGAHFFPDHTLAAARKKAWMDTKQDDCPVGWETVEQFVTRLRREALEAILETNSHCCLPR